MNKAELIESLATRLGDRKAAATALDSVVEEIQQAVAKGERVAISGFGVFEARTRNARTARNPRTGEPVAVAETTVPAFRPGQAFKNVVSGTSSEAPARAAAPGTTVTAEAPEKPVKAGKAEKVDKGEKAGKKSKKK